MKSKQQQLVPSLLLSALCGLISFFIEFFAVPQFTALPDPIWIAMTILLPVVAGAVLLRNISPAYVWVGLPVQYLLLYFLSKPVSEMLGVSPEGLIDFNFLFQAVVWPLAATLAQFLTMFCSRLRNAD